MYANIKVIRGGKSLRYATNLKMYANLGNYQVHILF